MVLLHDLFYEQCMEFINTHEAIMSPLQDKGKLTRNLWVKILVLRYEVVASGKSHKGNSKVKIPDLKPSGCARSAKELGNFLWDIDQYFFTA